MRVLADATIADGSRVDVVVGDDGTVAAVAAAGSVAPPPEVGDVDDLGGLLLVPAPAEPHAHLDKALSADRVPNPTGDLLGAIDAWVAARPTLTEDDIATRAEAAIRLGVANGLTAIRTHVDVGESLGTTALSALHRARAATAHLADVQIVALVSCPLTGPEGEGNRRALARALELGVDLVGGCPALDPRPAELIDLVLAAATEAGLALDLHVDETLDPAMLSLETLARRVLDTGFARPVTAGHCVSLGVQPPDVQARVARLVAEAAISVVTLPQTNLFLQGRDHPTATPRALTAIAALRDAGVVVAAGGDNVQDPFNPMGRGDPLETASLVVTAGHVAPDDAYEMVSGAARQAMGLAPVAVAVGSAADLVAVDAPSVRAALATGPGTRRTYRAGRLVARTDRTVGFGEPSA